MIVGAVGVPPHAPASWLASAGVQWAAHVDEGAIQLGHTAGAADSGFADDRLTVVAESRLAGGAGPTGAAAIARAYLRLGPRCVGELRGTFSFILHDAAQHRVVAANSLIPNAPLAYCTVGAMTLVSSRLIGLLRHEQAPRSLDESYLVHIVTGFAAMAPGTTAIQGIRRLCAGEALVFRGHAPSVVRVDRLEPRAVRVRGGAALVSAFWQELGAAAERTYSAHDRPCLSLSGGLDSAALTTALLSTGRRVDAFSFVADRMCAGAEGTAILSLETAWPSVHTSRIDVSDDIDFPDTGADDLRDDPLLVPLALLAARRKIWSMARAAGFRTIVEGEGGDELFSILPTPFDALHNRDWKALLRQFRIPNGRAARLQRGLVLPLLPASLRRGWARRSSAHLAPLPAFLVREALGRPSVRDAGEQYTLGLLHRSFRDRTEQWLSAPATVSATLSRTQFAASCGVELAWPLMDRAVVEFVLGLPTSELLSSAGEDKPFLRRALRGRIPEDVRTQPKELRLYYAFISTLLGSKRVLEFVRDERVRARLSEWVRWERLETMLERAREKKITSVSTLWQLESLVSFAQWYGRASRQFGVQ